MGGKDESRDCGPLCSCNSRSDFSTGNHKSFVLAESCFQELLSFLKAGALVYYLDSEDNLIFGGANEQAGRILGHDLKGFVGKRFEDMFPAAVLTEMPKIGRTVIKTGNCRTIPHFHYNDELVSGTYNVFCCKIAKDALVVLFEDSGITVGSYTLREKIDLLSFINEENKRGIAVPITFVAKKFDISRVTMDKWVAELERKGLVGVKKEGKYRFLELTGRGESFLCSFQKTKK